VVIVASRCSRSQRAPRAAAGRGIPDECRAPDRGRGQGVPRPLLVQQQNADYVEGLAPAESVRSNAEGPVRPETREGN
jgi:hypothetical protein